MKILLNELQALADSDRYPFHMPGHKRNLAGVLDRWFADHDFDGAVSTGTADADMRAALAQAARLDITEIDDFDNMHAPEGILKEAMQRAAALYGADETFYSVNGSTAGLLTAISAAVPEGSKVLVARNCHKAVYHALYLRRLQPVYLYPEVIEGISIADALKPQAIEQAFEEHPDAKALILTSPTYDGICADVKEIAQIVHDHGAILIVDAAHGAHFGFHPGFPESPVRLGADLTVVSLHKTLPAMTQTALLHVRGDRVDRARLRMFSGMYQTSSPSYFFMAGMDICMRMIKEQGTGLWENFWKNRAAFLEQTACLKNLRMITGSRQDQEEESLTELSDPCKNVASGVCMDAGKILIDSGKTGLTGQQLYDILLSQYHLQMEMAAGNSVTAIVTCCDQQEGWERLAKALIEIDLSAGCRQEPAKQQHRLYPKLDRGMSLTKALDAKKAECPLEAAAGRIAGSFVNLYPPGIPIVVPGEVLSEEVIALLAVYAREGLPLQGIADGCIWVVKSQI